MVNSGYKQKLYFGDENVYGSADAIDQPFGLVQSVNPTATNNLIKVRTMGGSRDYSNIVPGKFEISGNFDYYLQTGNFLRMAWGEDTGTTVTVDSGPKVHTGGAWFHILGSAASPTAGSFPSFTMEFNDDEDGGNPGTNNLKRLYTGCRVNNTSMSGTIDEPVMISTDFIAQGVTISTTGATSVTESTKDPYVFYQGVVHATTGAVTGYTQLGTTSLIAEVNGFDFSINNNLEAVWYINGTTNVYQTKRGLKELIVKGRDYEGSLNLHFSTKALYEKFLGAAGATESQETLTDQVVVLDFIRSGVIGATPKLAADDWVRIVMNTTKFNDINIAGSPEDIVNQNIGLDMASAIVYIVDDDADYQS